jgi:hypothetical protein
MDIQDSIAELARQVTYLRDRQEIADCLGRAARGTDRHDEALLLSAFHDDALDEHGGQLCGMPEFAAAVNDRHAEITRIHTHNLSTHTCEVDGDEAHVETYVMAGLAGVNEKVVQLCGARYLDRLERREVGWRIAFRRVVIDWILTGDATDFHSAAYRAMDYPVGTWDATDPSYERPLKPR